ncbi:MAG TPA: 2Fe-2S ferredoxin [Alphaproteobacteria bacterium]|jgi:nitrite reductase/ring-hydroxylating ferredoxin subunit|nr:2Fe-2S ferredoxin [Alphaproteobacteria bacterium]HBA44077.1 2Fe-2S ferredoxin [Alphaproteobacteria bacterium]HBF97517.1 2Fe-2S ferredoxin [Alphaproteobacteria bacterium]HCO91171.1 2Fe-2S ferredoxin [Alphaproteobacteria bacterium]
MSEPVFLCRLADLPPSGTKGFVLGSGTNRLDLFVIWRDGILRAYLNDCPHAHTPLETRPDRFLDQSGKYLLCTTHGARFTVAEGKCVSGPCRGKSLTPLPVTIRDGEIFLLAA